MRTAFPALIGDIGGTNARFEWLATADTAPQPLAIVKTEAFNGPEAAIAWALRSADLPAPQSALLAAAGPIREDGLDLTNCDWAIRPQHFLQTTGISRLQLFNDFEAQALALPFLDDDDIVPVGPAAAPRKTYTKAVLGPGTGLGVGLMVRAAGQWIPLPGEGGHVDLGPRTERERHIWSFLRTIEGRVSAEQILCGRGLENLHRAMVLEQRNRPPSELASALDFVLRDHEITAAALNDSDGLAAEAVDLFCTILGRVAGDLALTGLTHGGVYLAGGIVQKIEPLLHASGFRSAFEDKAPHGALMSQIAVSLIRHPLPALLGLAKLAQQPELFLVDLEHRSWKSRAG